MCAMLKEFPSIHCTFNLTSTLLQQLEEFYVEPLSKIVNRDSLIVKSKSKKEKGKNTSLPSPISTHTDSWFDLLVKPTEKFGEEEKNILYRNVWSCITISEPQLFFFPEYESLVRLIKTSLKHGEENFTTQQLRELKFWFFLANFDADFLLKETRLNNETTVNLSDIIERKTDGKFYLRKKVTEDDCKRLILETYKVLSAIIPLHKAMQRDVKNNVGQIELTTTPYTHPILPLIYDSDVAKICQPNDTLPPRFSFPEDAKLQLQLAVEKFKELFGAYPKGMWPSEGSVSQEILPLFSEHNIQWIATDEQILHRSKPEHQIANNPYSLNVGENELAIFFRNTRLSDKIGFDYQSMLPDDAANDFVQSILSFAKEDEQLITVIVDGENAWEWYRTNLDGKEFLRSLYKKLSEAQEKNEIVTVTPHEYLNGNASRGIAPHPISSLKKIDWLFPGSWINANFDTWIGEAEENKAWEYLLKARNDLKNCGIVPSGQSSISNPQSEVWNEMLAAEGSDWFWWYGEDQNSPAGDEPFDEAYRKHLTNIYLAANTAGANLEIPNFPSILSTSKKSERKRQHGGAMAQSSENIMQAEPKVKVTFRCNTNGNQFQQVNIVGNRDVLGNWTPNVIAMQKENDTAWKFVAEFFPGEEIQYKYSSGGSIGDWSSEEFALSHRTMFVPLFDVQEITIENSFGIV